MLKCFQDKQNSRVRDIMTAVIVVMWSMMWLIWKMLYQSLFSFCFDLCWQWNICPILSA